MRPTLMLPIKDRQQFLEMYFEKGGLGGLFVKGITELELGDEVDLELQFLDEQKTFRLQGQVRWRRTAGARRSLPPGLGIEFTPSQRSSEKKLLDFAMGREVTLVDRAQRRYPASLKVKVKADGRQGTEYTDDISENGAFLTDTSFGVGEVLDLHMRPPGALFGFALRARVAWRREEGRRGVGLEFMFDSERKRHLVARLVQHIHARTIQELKVRVPRA